MAYQVKCRNRTVRPGAASNWRPRHFLYPAILLLLAEQPRHGYRLMDALLGLGFGPMDRPGCTGHWPTWNATACSTRGWPPHGRLDPACLRGHGGGAEVLDHWMRVIADERDGLDRVLFRYLKVAPNSG